MDKQTRLLKKARKTPQSVTYKEIKKLAVYFGFILDSHNSSSHTQYKRSDDPYGFMNFQPRVGDKKMAKIYQVRQLVKFIDEHSLSEGL